MCLFFMVAVLLGVLPGFVEAARDKPTVRLVYFIPNDREAQPDIDTELDTLIKNVQNFYATQLEAHGFDRKTFRIETDNSGNAIAHHINGKFNDLHYQENRGIWEEVREQFDMSKHIYLCFVESHGNCLVLQHSTDNPCIVGLGSGNYINGTALVLYDSIEDEDRNVYSENVAIHELCHAFGMMHDKRFNAKRIYVFGYLDRMVSSFCAAEWLDGHRYFNDRETHINQNTKAEMLTPVRGSPWHYIRFRFQVVDPDGLHQVQLFSPRRDSLADYKSLNGISNSTVEFDTNNWTGETNFTLRVMDVYGNFQEFYFPIDVDDLLPSPEAIDISDPNFASVVRETLGISKEDAITQLDMIRLKTLRAEHSQITDITGIEHALNLEIAGLNDNEIRDVTPLSGLKQLKRLGVRGSQIRDITPLTSLTTLDELDLTDIQINDIKPLANLPQLKKLFLWGNRISDLTPLASLTALEELSLGMNQVNDIKALSGLTQLKSLGLFSNQVADITPVTDLKKLRSLELGLNQVSDITPLASLTQLKSLDMWRNQVTNISPLASLTTLEYLDISDNRISDVSFLEGLVNLEQLRLIGNPIKNRKPLFALLRKNPDVKIYLKNIAEPLPVSLSSFKAVRTAEGAVINWTTESELNNAGFNILRSQTQTGEFRKVNAKLIQGAGTTGERSTYTWTDTTAKSNTVYYYQIEDVSHAGVHQTLAKTRLRGLVSAKGKMVTRWAHFKNSQ